MTVMFWRGEVGAEEYIARIEDAGDGGSAAL